MRARRLFPSIHAARKPLKRFLLAIRSARPGWLCTRMARPPTIIVPGRNTAARSVNPKPANVPATTRTGITGRKTGAARNTRPFQTITGFPLTGNACVLSVSMPCVQSVSVTIPVSNPQVRNGCGCVAEPARQTSIRWPTSPL